MEDNVPVLDAVNEDLIGIRFGVAFRPGWRVSESRNLSEEAPRRAERPAQVSDVVYALAAVASALLVGANQLIIHLLQIPVVDKGHQNLQPLKLARPHEWI